MSCSAPSSETGSTPTGGNAQTARLAGVPVARVKIILFVCASLAAVLTGDQRDADLPERQHHARRAICLHRHRRGGHRRGAADRRLWLAGRHRCSAPSTYGIVSLGVFFLGWNADLANFFIGLLLLLAVLANHRLRELAMGRG